MRPLQAHCHLGLGAACNFGAQRAEARAALSAASDRYRTLEMTFWLPQSAVALAQVE